LFFNPKKKSKEDYHALIHTLAQGFFLCISSKNGEFFFFGFFFKKVKNGMIYTLIGP
jgi:hypothetical protein